MESKNSSIQCEWMVNPDQKWLERHWRALEAQAEPNLFLSWLWIGTWLDCFVDNCCVVLARQEDKIVGLGIIVMKEKKIAGLSYGRQFCLHRTGIPSQDQIWIEYNDFLMEKALANTVRPLMTACVMSQMNGTDIFEIGASLDVDFVNHGPQSVAADCGSGGADPQPVLSGLALAEKEVVWESVGFALDFGPLKDEQQTLDSFLSRNARYQIKRSLKKYSALGEVKITTASSVTQGLEFFNHAADYHLSRWGSKSEQSGFANPGFLHFHHELIRRGLPQRQVAIHHLQAGEEDLGVIYNFHHANWVLFYLSALNYGSGDNHLKPGLVAHYLLIQDAWNKGALGYDFMGGIARYKKTFANRECRLAISQFRYPHFTYSVKKVIRALKRRALKRRVLSESSSDCP
ncbi:GNAT family N-acetyltransferase [Photobacterium sp. Hal280]|uniref:GNAT family N-acetyltransferase n=1 Tax=Photobacterium sp. Hal280 TaxID=3035163 RepID=UPI00301DAECE